MTERKKMGRPRKIPDEERLQEIIDEYFLRCEENGDIPTTAGLALAIGVTSKTLRRHETGESGDDLCPTIKRAKQRVEEAWERALLRGGSGVIFWLKNNAGWKDQPQADDSDKQPIFNIVVQKDGD